MANFGLTDLAMVNGRELADESYARSKSGRPILENSKRYKTIEEAINQSMLVLGIIFPQCKNQLLKLLYLLKKIP